MSSGASAVAPAPRCLRVGHSIVAPGSSLAGLPERLQGTAWDMVELDVMSHGDELVVAHDPSDLTLPEPVRFSDAIAALRELLPPTTRFDVDIKAIGYERRVLDVLRDAEIVPRTLVSTMERSSLHALRGLEPGLALGLSVPKARRDYLAHPLTRLGAYGMLAYLRRALPSQVGRVLRSGQADAIMAHWGTVTPRLVSTVRDAGGELYVWTVDDPRRLVALQRLGVTGVITNERDLFSQAGLAPPA